MRFLSFQEVAALADAIDPRYRAFVTLASYGGLRAGELIRLRRPNVDVLHRLVSVVEQVQIVGGVAHLSTPKTAAGCGSPPREPLASPRCASTTSATPAPRWPSPPAPTSRSSSGCSAKPLRR